MFFFLILTDKISDVITVEEGMEDSNVSIKLAYPPSSPVVLLPTISFSNDSKCSPGGLGSCVVPCPSQLFFDGNNWDEAQVKLNFTPSL